MKNILNRLINQETLSKSEAKDVLVRISQNQYNASQMACFMTVFMMRNCTIEELSGFREALLELCVSVDFSQYNTIDLCGTGGDGKDTFNISTLASFVVAGTGIKVAKHGNYGVSSISGSSNVVENLGIKLSNDNTFLQKSIDKANIAILHAPLFHPAMKNVASIRKELAVKTFFNILGPLVNPSSPKNQMVGVYNLELARMYSYVFQNTTTNFCILHGLDGFDEISLTDQTKIISKTSETILNPESFKVSKITLEQIKGGATIKDTTQLFQEIINGKGTLAQNNVVCANAAVAISTVQNCSILEGFEKAKESLLSGKAAQKMKILQNLSK